MGGSKRVLLMDFAFSLGYHLVPDVKLKWAILMDFVLSVDFPLELASKGFLDEFRVPDGF